MSRKTVWECAVRGEIGGAIRTEGGQFRFPREEAKRWALLVRQQQNAVEKRRRAAKRLRDAEWASRYKGGGYITIQAVVFLFLQWARKSRASVLEQPLQTLLLLRDELAPFEKLIREVNEKIAKLSQNVPQRRSKKRPKKT